MLRAFLQPGTARAVLRRNIISNCNRSIYHARDYMILHTTYNPESNLPRLPTTLPPLPTPPKSILLFLTPYYASLLTTPSSSLIAAHVTTLLPPDDRSTCDILAAVVDDLPSYPPSPAGNPASTSTSTSTHTRNEGWSWLITDSPNLINRTLSPSPTGSPQATQPPAASTTTPGQTLSPQGHPLPSLANTGRRSSNSPPTKPLPLIFSFPNNTSVAITLANTLFQTGRLATVGRVCVRKGLEGGLVMFTGEEGGVGAVGEGWDTVNRVYRIEIPPPGEGEEGYKYTSNIPLIPLTPARKVLACAGNILREISPSSSSSDTSSPSSHGVPASHELELAVDTYLSQQPPSSPPSKLDIFALITPPSNTHTPSPRPNPWDLTSGQKLRRVLSGGGGWGKKMGLLSIDPQGGTYALGDEEYARLHYDDDGVCEGDGSGGISGREREEEERFKRDFERRFFGARDDIKDVRGVGQEKLADQDDDDGHTILSKGCTIQFFLAAPSPRTLPHPQAAYQKHQYLILGCLHKDSLPAFPPSQPTPQELPTSLTGEEVSYEMGRVRKGVEVPGVFGGRGEEGVWVSRSDEGRRASGKMDVPGGELVVVLGGSGIEGKEEGGGRRECMEGIVIG